MAAEEGAETAGVNQVESLCMRCGRNGITRLLLTRVPHFRELVLMAFECPHCGESNSEVQFAGQIGARGWRQTLTVDAGDAALLNRQVVKSDSATILVPEIELEIPPQAQRGSLSTVEGVLTRAMEELQALQGERWKADPSTAAGIDQFLIKLKACATGVKGFTFVVDDPAGNSFVENPHAPAPDPLLQSVFYDRTPEQQAALGYVAEVEQEKVEEGLNGRYVAAGTSGVAHGAVGAGGARRAIAQGESGGVASALFKYSAPEEVMRFPGTCGACGVGCETRMFVTNIPYFKEVIVMASTCDLCGYRNSEVKAGGSIPATGRRIRLRVTKLDDLSRDVIKSDTASVHIPEMSLELAPGTLGGLVTTVEGLVSNINDSLARVSSFSLGDSAATPVRERWQDFHRSMQKLKVVEEPWTLVLDDALANSFIAPATDQLEDDTQLSVEEYERTWQQNEELGLNDMDTSSAADATHGKTGLGKTSFTRNPDR